MESALDSDPVGFLEGLAVAARSRGRARFSMWAAVGDDEPDGYSGVLDLRSGEFSSATQCFVDGVHYGRLDDDSEAWISFSRKPGDLPISPLWLVTILHGAETAQPDSRTGEGDILISAVCDVDKARRLSGIGLAGLGGDPRRRVSVTVAADEGTQLVRRVAARFESWSFVCDYFDFETGAEIVAPTSSTPVDADLSPARRWLARRFPTLSIWATAARVKRFRQPPTSE